MALLLYWWRRVLSKSLHMLIVTLSSILEENVRVYMFHSIGDDFHQLNISTEDFNTFLSKICKKKVIRLEEWDRKRGGCGLSFDDVPSSFYYNAYPLLKKYDLPFTLFVSCSLLNQNGYITNNQLKEIANCKLCTIGSHGFNHGFYREFSAEEAKYDLQSSRMYLEEIIGRPVELFAFPYGSFFSCGYKRKNIVGSFYKYGFSTVNCPITSPSLLSSFFLPRISVDNSLIRSL